MAGDFGGEPRVLGAGLLFRQRFNRSFAFVATCHGWC